MLYKNYENYSDHDKKALIQELYVDKGLSFGSIAEQLNTYANKIRRDAIKYKISIRDKSEAQSNALKQGVHKHPTKGTKRSDTTKEKIGKSVMTAWDSLTGKELKERKEKAQQLWNNLSEDEKQNRLTLANKAVRESSKVGSKLEHFLLNCLVSDGYKVEFHKEQLLSNTKLQIDLFLPTINIAIEVDGPSHFLPVWGQDTLAKNKKYDEKKSGLIVGKGLKLIRIKQLHDFSKSRGLIVYQNLIKAIKDITTSTNVRSIEIED
jgi:very-short-patch-repair endonuclease